MSAGVVLRVYRPGDEAAINESFQSVFGVERRLDEWAWKFRDRGRGRWIALALDDDARVLAHYSAIPVRFRCGDLETWVGQVVDCYSLPEVRHRHVFADLYQFFIDHFLRPSEASVLFGFPGRRHFELGRKLLQYTPLGSAPYLQSGVPRWSPVRTSGGFDTLLDWRDEDGAAVWAATAARCRIGVVRDREYLAWRYRERPGVDYLRVATGRRGQLHAVAAARVVAGRLRVADLLWDGRDPRAVAALSRSLGALARRHRCRIVEAWLGGDPLVRSLLFAAGWSAQPGPEDLVWVARTCHPAVDLDVLARDQYLSCGDSDLV